MDKMMVAPVGRLNEIKLTDLTLDVRRKIFGYLNTKDLLNLRLVQNGMIDLAVCINFRFSKNNNSVITAVPYVTTSAIEIKKKFKSVGINDTEDILNIPYTLFSKIEEINFTQKRLLVPVTTDHIDILKNLIARCSRIKTIYAECRIDNELFHLLSILIQINCSTLTKLVIADNSENEAENLNEENNGQKTFNCSWLVKCTKLTTLAVYIMDNNSTTVEVCQIPITVSRLTLRHPVPVVNILGMVNAMENLTKLALTVQENYTNSLGDNERSIFTIDMFKKLFNKLKSLNAVFLSFPSPPKNEEVQLKNRLLEIRTLCNSIKGFQVKITRSLIGCMELSVEVDREVFNGFLETELAPDDNRMDQDDTKMDQDTKMNQDDTKMDQDEGKTTFTQRMMSKIRKNGNFIGDH